MELWGSRTKSTNPLSTAILAKKPCVFVVNASMFGYLTFPVIDWQTNCWRPQAIADQSTTNREFCRKTSWIFLHQHVVHYETFWKLFRRTFLRSRGWVKDRDISIKRVCTKAVDILKLDSSSRCFKISYPIWNRCNIATGIRYNGLTCCFITSPYMGSYHRGGNGAHLLGQFCSWVLYWIWLLEITTYIICTPNALHQRMCGGLVCGAWWGLSPPRS